MTTVYPPAEPPFEPSDTLTLRLLKSALFLCHHHHHQEVLEGGVCSGDGGGNTKVKWPLKPVPSPTGVLKQVMRYKGEGIRDIAPVMTWI